MAEIPPAGSILAGCTETPVQLSVTWQHRAVKGRYIPVKRMWSLVVPWSAPKISHFKSELPAHGTSYLFSIGNGVLNFPHMLSKGRGTGVAALWRRNSPELLT